MLLLVPLLVLIGDKESTFDAKLAVNRADRLTDGAEVFHLPDVGHMIAMEATRVNVRINRFVAD